MKPGVFGFGAVEAAGLGTLLAVQSAAFDGRSYGPSFPSRLATTSAQTHLFGIRDDKAAASAPRSSSAVSTGAMTCHFRA
jgi:hypothetical protein